MTINIINKSKFIYIFHSTTTVRQFPLLSPRKLIANKIRRRQRIGQIIDLREIVVLPLQIRRITLKYWKMWRIRKRIRIVATVDAMRIPYFISATKICRITIERNLLTTGRCIDRVDDLRRKISIVYYLSYGRKVERCDAARITIAIAVESCRRRIVRIIIVIVGEQIIIIP